MTARMPWLLVLAALLLAMPGLLAGCGDHRKPSAGGGTSGAADADADATPYLGRDAKEVVSAFGEDGRAVLEEADEVTLVTLNPSQLVDGVLSPEKERMRGYGILGTAEVTDPAERRRLVEALYEGLKAEGAGPASCFLPRHGLRFRKGERTLEALICFECTWIHFYADGAEHPTKMLFGAGVKPVFDAIVKKRALKTDRP